MLVSEVVDNVIELAPSSHNIVMNMRQDSAPRDRVKAEKSLIRMINEALRDLSIKFALSQGTIDLPYRSDITVTDSQFLEFMEVYADGVAINLREFRNQNNRSWYRPTGLNSIQLSPDLSQTYLHITYAKLIGSVHNLTDTLPIMDVFVKAIEAYVLMRMSATPATQNQADDTRGTTYKAWMDALEELEALGYRRADLIYGSRTNAERGWLEW